MNTPLALAVLTLCLALPVQAAMYKWVDKDGSVVYSETPPPNGTDAITLTLPPPRPDVPEARPGNTAALGQSASDGSHDTSTGINEENEQVRQRFEEARRHNCEIARQNLETYRTAARIRTPDNQVVNLDDATRAARVQQAERDIATYCK